MTDLELFMALLDRAEVAYDANDVLGALRVAGWLLTRAEVWRG